MSDAQRRYQEIRKSLSGLYGFEADGNVARHMNTMTAMINGIIGSQRTNLPQVAQQGIPSGDFERQSDQAVLSMGQQRQD